MTCKDLIHFLGQGVLANDIACLQEGLALVGEAKLDHSLVLACELHGALHFVRVRLLLHALDDAPGHLKLERLVKLLAVGQEDQPVVCEVETPDLVFTRLLHLILLFELFALHEVGFHAVGLERRLRPHLGGRREQTLVIVVLGRHLYGLRGGLLQRVEGCGPSLESWLLTLCHLYFYQFSNN